MGLSTGAAHERVRKLRAAGVITATTAVVDPHLIGHGVVAFVSATSDAWMGDDDTRTALLLLPEVLEAHVVAGRPTLLLKVRATSMGHLQSLLRRVYDVVGVTGVETTVVLDSFFERPPDPLLAASAESPLR